MAARQRRKERLTKSERIKKKIESVVKAMEGNKGPYYDNRASRRSVMSHLKEPRFKFNYRGRIR